MLRLQPFPDCLSRQFVVVGVLLAHGWGCSKAAPTSGDALPASQVNDRSPQQDSDAPDAVPADGNGSPDEPSHRTKWVGEIPYDVFFDQPLSVAAGDDGAATTTAVTSESPHENEPETLAGSRGDGVREADADGDADGDPAIGSPSSSTDWRRLADIEVLNDEVKQIRNRLTADLRTVGTYNRNLDSVANDAVVLAAVAAVVAAHPDSLSWQKKAKIVRDLSTRLAAQAGEPGREAFLAAQVPFEQLIEILDGGPPPDDAIAADIPFCEIADRSELMKRIKRSFDWLKSEINSESRFRRSPDALAREASLLAVLGAIVSSECYDLSGEPQYQQFVHEFIEGNVGMATADSYQTFTTARDRVQNSCATCHGEYALGDEGL